VSGRGYPQDREELILLSCGIRACLGRGQARSFRSCEKWPALARKVNGDKVCGSTAPNPDAGIPVVPDYISQVGGAGEQTEHRHAYVLSGRYILRHMRATETGAYYPLFRG